jgi:site-specific recombinase XerD
VVKRRRPDTPFDAWPTRGCPAALCAHQLRHAHAVEMAREGIPLNVIQRRLGHANLGITIVWGQVGP